MDHVTQRVLLVVALLLAACPSCSRHPDQSPQPPPRRQGGQSGQTTPPEGDRTLTCSVRRGTFIHDVTQNGSVESANYGDIRCEVEAHGDSGIMILWIIPEGTYIEPAPDWEPKEPGEEPPDLLVRLDSSSLEAHQTQQQIVVNASEAALMEAKSLYERAILAQREYVEGKHEEELLLLQMQRFVAEERLRSAQHLPRRVQGDTRGTQEAVAENDIPPSDSTTESFAVAKARKELELANTRLEVLQKYTKPKMLAQLESQVAAAGARLNAQQYTHQLDLNKLAEIEEQIEKCTIRAPQAGQVVYANVIDSRGGQEIIIEEGTRVRERQTIIRLPDFNRMQVKARIDEARLSRVEVGMDATIQLDAFPDLEPMSGTVEKVSEYPLPSSWFSGNIKEYETIVRFTDLPKDLDIRPGMAAQVKIRVERLDDVLIVPVQAVLEHAGKHYCAIRDGEGWKKREVTIGSTNDKEVVIKTGLTAGEQVALGAALYRDELDLPKIAE